MEKEIKHYEFQLKENKNNSRCSTPLIREMQD
jgi:hypothetical protein